MRRSQTITVQIGLSWRQVYAFLAEPTNFPRWASVTPCTFRQVEGSEWEGEMLGAVRRVRFCAPNEWGVLDHAILFDGQEPMVTPMRVVANADGAEVLFTFFQRDGMSDEQFSSTLEWITADLWALKSMLEA